MSEKLFIVYLLGAPDPTDLPYQQPVRAPSVHLTVTAASLNQFGNILASRMQTVTLIAHSQDPAQLPEVASRFLFMLRIPRKTRRVRVIIQAGDGGRIGSAELDRKAIDAAPVVETPRPELQRRPATYSSSPPAGH